MTDIYTPEGALDYVAAAAELKNAKNLTNDARAGHTVDRVAAAALLDIAVSLARITQLAEGAEFPLGSDAPDERGGPTVDDPDDGEDERRVEELDIGDRVTVTIAPDMSASGIIRALGQSEGDDWAEVAWGVDEGEAEHVTRVWVRELRREVPEENAKANADEEPDARDLVERDIDADFGQAQPVECGATLRRSSGVTYGPCTRRPAHKSTKHRDAEGREWRDGASDA